MEKANALTRMNALMTSCNVTNLFYHLFLDGSAMLSHRSRTKGSGKWSPQQTDVYLPPEHIMCRLVSKIAQDQNIEYSGHHTILV